MILAHNAAAVQPAADFVPADVLDTGDPVGPLTVRYHDAGDGLPWCVCDGLGRILDVFRTCGQAHAAAAPISPPLGDCTLDFGDALDPQGPTEDDLTSYAAGLLYTAGEWNEMVERAARGLIDC